MLVKAIRPHHHQRRPLLGCQMLRVGSHRNTLPERCGTWLLSRRIYFFGGRAVIGTAKCPWIFALIVGSRKSKLIGPAKEPRISLTSRAKSVGRDWLLPDERT
jgi:hypothetical protein